MNESRNGFERIAVSSRVTQRGVQQDGHAEG
jgi:hypothetical protein